MVLMNTVKSKRCQTRNGIQNLLFEKFVQEEFADRNTEKNGAYWHEDY